MSKLARPTACNRLAIRTCVTILLIAAATIGRDGSAEEKPFGLEKRIQWTTSNVKGWPEPPPPYTVEARFLDVDWERPVYAKAEPNSEQLWVVQQGGEKDRPTRILRIDDSDNATECKLLMEIDGRLVYGLEFHPDFETNGHIFLFSNGPTGKPERKNRISKFTFLKNPLENEYSIDPASELSVIEWRSMGHDGGELAFGNDGMLYISSGDGTSDSDTWYSAQDLSNLNGGVLRIDVNSRDDGRAYSIPKDNPFLDIKGARGEIWAYGLRNPWRLWADHLTGQIWVGNNGQDLWETVHLIRRGENYGWSVYEGSHPFYINRQRGPTPIVPPTIEHHHTEARSLTGGVVYRGDKLPELDGAYIYGDYATGKIWAARHNGTKLTFHTELADTTLQIAGFANSPLGHLLVVDHGGGLYRLVKRPSEATKANAFPRSLSETGLFTSVSEHRPHSGVIPYSVNASSWNDGAIAERFLAIPNEETIATTPTRGWNFPNGSVIVQTLSIPATDRIGSQRIETRLLHREQNEWLGYSYRWNDAQTDANLVAEEGEDVTLDWPTDDGGTESRDWHIPSRAECMSCHSRAVNYVLGLSSPQMDRDCDYGASVDNQVRTLTHIGLISNEPPKKIDTLVDPYDSSEDLQLRAKSYLHANCSSCHVEAGGGNARMELEIHRPLDEMRILLARPQHATFGIQNAMLVSPGEPDRSVLLHRVSQRGVGQMPPLMTRAVDRQGVALIREWIKSLPKVGQKFVKAWTLEELASVVDQLEQEASVAQGKSLYKSLGCVECHRLASQGGGSGPDLSNIATLRKPLEILESILEPSKQIAPKFAAVVIITDDGRSFEGRVEAETGNAITLRWSNTDAGRVEIDKTAIEERFMSTKSQMPAGILNVCTDEQIRDLLAYLVSTTRGTD